MKIKELKPIEIDPNTAYLDKSGQVHFIAAPRVEWNPELPHNHPCAACQEPIECFCPFPKVDLKDQLALCHRCEEKD